MGSSTETIKNVDVSRIVKDSQLGNTFKALILNAGENIPNGAPLVNESFGQSMVNIGGLYNEKYMKALKYDTKDTITYRVFDVDKLLSWMQKNVNPGISDISSYERGSVSLTEDAITYLEVAYPGFNNTDRTLVAEDGYNYKFKYTVNNGRNYDIVLAMTDGAQTADKYVKTTYASNQEASVVSVGSLVDGFWTITVKFKQKPVTASSKFVTRTISIPEGLKYISKPDPTYDIGASIAAQFNGRGAGYGEYSTEVGTSYYGWSVATVKYLGNYEFSVTATAEYEYDRENDGLQAQANNLQAVYRGIREAMDKFLSLKVYYILDGKVYLYQNLDSAFGNLYSNKRATIFPIIPFKENGVHVKNSRARKAILSKIGMENKTFRETLAQKELNSAYLMFGVSPSSSNKVATKCIYETLDKLRSGTATGGLVSVGGFFRGRVRQDMKMQFKGMTVETQVYSAGDVVSGSIGPIGTYKRVNFAMPITSYDIEGNPYNDAITTIRFQKQITEEFYNEIILYDVTTVYTGVGSYFVEGMRDRGGALNPKCVIPLVRDTFTELNIKDKCKLLELSMNLVVFVVQEIKLKWYQTTLFSVIVMVVIMVVAAVSQQYYAIGAASALTAVEVAAITASASMAAIASVASFTLMSLQMMGTDLGIFGQIAGIVLAVYGGYSAYTNTTLSTANTAFAMASAAVDIVGQVNSLLIQKDLKALMTASQNSALEKEEVRKRYEEMQDTLKQSLILPFVNRLDEIDMYYDMAVGGRQCNYDILFSYENAYSQNILTA